MFGEKKDRKTLHGQLGWIMAGLVEAIAWDSLTKDESHQSGTVGYNSYHQNAGQNQAAKTRQTFKLFHDQFRGDMLLSSLYKNFVLADRVMRSYGCNPQARVRNELTFMWGKVNVNFTL